MFMDNPFVYNVSVCLSCSGPYLLRYYGGISRTNGVLLRAFCFELGDAVRTVDDRTSPSESVQGRAKFFSFISRHPSDIAQQ